MKPYIKPVIKSAQVVEQTALACSDYGYYCKSAVPCYDTYLGQGKDDSRNCGSIMS